MSFFDRHDQHNSGGYNIQNNIDNSVHNTNINPVSNSAQQSDDYLWAIVSAFFILGGTLLRWYDQFSIWVQKWFWLICGIVVAALVLEVIYVYNKTNDGKKILCNIIQASLTIGSLVIWKLLNVDEELRPIMRVAEKNFFHYVTSNSGFGSLIIYCLLQIGSLLLIVTGFGIETYHLFKNKKFWCGGWIIFLYLLVMGLIVVSYFLVTKG